MEDHIHCPKCGKAVRGLEVCHSCYKRGCLACLVALPLVVKDVSIESAIDGIVRFEHHVRKSFCDGDGPTYFCLVCLQKLVR